MKPVFLRSEGNEGGRRLTCYVCGTPRCAEYPLAIRQQASGPYFPFLETHEPPDGAEPPTADGHIVSCYLCYSCLTQQWELYERDKVPPVKRIYWLKRADNGPYTGVEVGVQSEYASQLLGLTPDTPLQSDIKRPGPSSSSSSVRAHPTPAIVPPPTTLVETKRMRVLPPQAQPPTAPLPAPSCVLPLPTGLPLPQTDPQQEALDLSVDTRRGTKRPQPEPSSSPPLPPQPPQTEGLLDLSMPDRNATTEVCYVCGEHYKKGTLVHIYTTQQGKNCPFFPSLMLHSRPSKSHPMEASGRVQGCKECFSHLHRQWEAFELHKVPYKDRHYNLRKRHPVTPAVRDSTAFICYHCGTECPSSKLCLVYCKPNAEKEPFYPFIEKLDPHKGASPISPQGMVQVCNYCFKAIPQQQKRLEEKPAEPVNIPSPKNVLPDLKKSPELNNTGHGGNSLGSPAAQNSSIIMPLAVGESGADDVTCYLCHQVHHRKLMHWLSMVENKSSNTMYFLFLKFLPRMSANTVVEDGKVLACHLCYQHLSTQWEEYEKENVPTEQRQFSLRTMPVTSLSPRLTPGSRHGSPDITVTDTATPLSFASAANQFKSTEVNTINKAGYLGQPLHTLEVVPATINPKTPTLPVISAQRALNVTVNCFVCSSHSSSGKTYALRSKPLGHDPFFPFLAKHQSAHPEARIDASCVLVCLFCFHSLILQWQNYEKAQVDHHARLYDTYNYCCYICSLKTYRKRLYILSVKDYPFLKDHSRPSGGMIVENGHAVVVCKDCFSSLNSQTESSVVGLQAHINKQPDENVVVAGVNIIPKTSAVVKIVSPEIITSNKMSSIPSYCAPLQVKNGIASQGGNKQQGNFSERHTVAPFEGVSNGDVTGYRFSGSSVDQSTKRFCSENKLPAMSKGLNTSIKTAASNPQSLEYDKIHSPKKDFIIRATHPEVSSSLTTTTSTAVQNVCISPLKLHPHELQAECS